MSSSYRCVLCRGSTSRLLYRKDGFEYRRCAGCALVQRHPWPNEAELAALYRENAHYADELERSESQFLERDRRLLADLAERFGAEGPLLDVGAGAGLLLRAACERGWRAVGIETSRPAAQRIRERIGAEVHETPLERAPLAEGSFGVVTFSHSLEHLPDPAGALSRTVRLLGPGGVVHVAVPNFASWKRLAAGRHVPWIYPHHLSYFEAPTLRRAVEGAGLEVLEVRHGVYPGPDYPFVLALLRRGRLDGPLARWLRLGGRPLESLIADDVRIDCPVWRFRALVRFARAVLAVWPDRLSVRFGGADELRLTARRPLATSTAG